jgi:monoamine oxidase
MHEVDVVVVGAGAAGVAAGRRLSEANIAAKVLEARSRLGGRAWTMSGEFTLDLGCEWLHSGDENEWTGVAESLSLNVDRSFAPWSRIRNELGMSAAEQDSFRAAMDAYSERLTAAARRGVDMPAAALFEPGNRWNALISAISTYANGVEAERLSIIDYDRYYDSGVNWRVREGYGTTIAGYAQGLDVAFDCAVTRIDHAGARIRVETSGGTLSCRAVIVTVPTPIIAGERIRFDPPLPEKVAAAKGLPLGLADKVFLRVADADDLPSEERLFGVKDRTATGSYHLRPFGLPVIEGFICGELARALEREGEQAQTAFALDELAGHFGNDFRKRLSPIATSRWARDEFALGSYSAAEVGHADARGKLAEPVDGRIFFAGEACSLRDFSTAHGALRTGRDAAGAVMSILTV